MCHSYCISTRILLVITFSLTISVHVFRFLITNTSIEHEQNGIFETMLQRRKLINDFCVNRANKTENLKKIRYTIKKMFIDTEHNISWCPVFKAASSTWMKGFAQLGGVLNKKVLRLVEKGVLQWNMVARRAFPLSKNVAFNKWNQTTRFVIVRHPFERILSAYRDKLEHRAGREYYFRQYGAQISRLYRRTWQNQPEPTFREFLVFLTKTKAFDEHWKPITEQCQPCALQYNYILKTDTFEQDNYYLLSILGLNKFLNISLKENINPAGKTDMILARYYYSKIPRTLLQNIYEIYKDDFISFDYSPNAYYDMTK